MSRPVLSTSFYLSFLTLHLFPFIFPSVPLSTLSALQRVLLKASTDSCQLHLQHQLILFSHPNLAGQLKIQLWESHRSILKHSNYFYLNMAWLKRVLRGERGGSFVHGVVVTLIGSCIKHVNKGVDSAGSFIGTGQHFLIKRRTATCFFLLLTGFES